MSVRVGEQFIAIFAKKSAKSRQNPEVRSSSGPVLGYYTRISSGEESWNLELDCNLQTRGRARVCNLLYVYIFRLRFFLKWIRLEVNNQ